MPKRRGEEEEKENGERWLLTYSDMITLLLALFIMMYAMSTLDAGKYSSLSGELSAVLNPGGSYISAIAKSSRNGESAETGSAGPGANLSGLVALSNGRYTAVTESNLEEKLQEIIAESNMQNFASVHAEERGIVVSITEGLLFSSGSAEINERATQVLTNIITIAKAVNNYIRIEGSTDNIPIKNSHFPSNWELASQRAINVARLLIDGGVAPERIATVSYGEYRPVAENDSDEHRQQNRRVDIVFIDLSLSVYEAGYDDKAS